MTKNTVYNYFLIVDAQSGEPAVTRAPQDVDVMAMLADGGDAFSVTEITSEDSLADANLAMNQYVDLYRKATGETVKRFHSRKIASKKICAHIDTLAVDFSDLVENNAAETEENTDESLDGNQISDDDIAGVIEDLDRMLGISQAAEKSDHILSPEMRKQLDKFLPPSAFDCRTDDDGKSFKFVRRVVTDYLAMKIFGDRWNTKIIETSFQSNGKYQRSGADGRKAATYFRVVATARVRVTVTGPNGKVSHEGVGVGADEYPYDNATNGDIRRTYNLALKGAVSDARRHALQNFGQVFGGLESRDEEGKINEIKKDQSARHTQTPLQEAEEAFPAPAAKPAVEEEVKTHKDADDDGPIPDLERELVAEEFVVFGFDEDKEKPIALFADRKPYVERIISLIGEVPDLVALSLFDDRNQPVFERLITQQKIEPEDFETISQALDDRALQVGEAAAAPTAKKPEPDKQPAKARGRRPAAKPKKGGNTGKTATGKGRAKADIKPATAPKVVELAAFNPGPIPENIREFNIPRLMFDDQGGPKNLQPFGQAMLAAIEKIENLELLQGMYDYYKQYFSFVPAPTTDLLEKRFKDRKAAIAKPKAA